MNKILLLILSICLSCTNHAQEEKVIHKVEVTKGTFKFQLNNVYEKKDSSYVYLYIPRAFSLQNRFNTKISLQQSYWSKNGGNISEGNILSDNNGVLKPLKYPIKIKEGDHLDFKIYTRFKMVISSREVAELKIIFNRDFEERKTYEISFTPDLLSFLNKKIPKKGYTRFRMYNTDTKKTFFHNIPFDF